MIAQWIEAINASTPLLPHGICLASQPWLIAGLIIGHFGIAIAYAGIPVVMQVIERRVAARGVTTAAFKVSGLYRAFILMCGLTHLTAIVTLYIAVYEIYLGVLIITMVVSILTLIALVRLINPIVDLIADIMERQWETQR